VEEALREARSVIEACLMMSRWPLPNHPEGQFWMPIKPGPTSRVSGPGVLARYHDLRYLCGSEGSRAEECLHGSRWHLTQFRISTEALRWIIIWVEGNSKTIRDGREKVLYYEGTLADITERKRQNRNWRTSRSNSGNPRRWKRSAVWPGHRARL